MPRWFKRLWAARPRTSYRTIHRTSRPMTPAEREAFDAVFTAMDKFFKVVDK